MTPPRRPLPNNIVSDTQQAGVPAEWDKQTGLLITWPHHIDTWGKSVFYAVEDALRQVIALVAPTQTVIIACHDAELIGRLAIDMGGIQGDLRFLHAPSNDIWARDHGPISCRRGDATDFLDFQFNGWGEKYPSELDNRITSNLDDQCVFQSNVVYQNFILEGGSIESDGRGTLLTTSACLQHPLRNPDYSRSEIEAYLRKHLHASRILWLESGFLCGDDTDSHIDNLARFLAPEAIAYTSCDDPKDEHYLALQKMKSELELLRTADDQPYTLLPLNIPQAVRNENGDRLPASYANFLITNEFVFVPQFGDDNDKQALDTLTPYFPSRRVIGIDGRALVHQYGGIHCATMNLFGLITD